MRSRLAALARLRGPAAAARAAPAALAVLALGGCGAPGRDGDGRFALTVTRDFGAATTVPGRRLPVPARGGLERLLDAHARAGAGATRGLFVNGIAPVTAARAAVHAGDRVWLDLRPRGAAAHVPAVVGSFPEPFLHGTGGRRLPVRVECDDPDGEPCTTVAERLVALGAVAGRSVLGGSAADESLRVLVAPWPRLRGSELEADRLDAGPRRSGVFARFERGGRRLVVLDARGAPARTLGAGAGLVAATREGMRAPLWFVTGTDAAGVAAAARAFDESVLGERYALAIARDLPVAVPQPRRARAAAARVPPAP